MQACAASGHQRCIHRHMQTVACCVPRAWWWPRDRPWAWAHRSHLCRRALPCWWLAWMIPCAQHARVQEPGQARPAAQGEARRAEASAARLIEGVGWSSPAPEACRAATPPGGATGSRSACCPLLSSVHCVCHGPCIAEQVCQTARLQRGGLQYAQN